MITFLSIVCLVLLSIVISATYAVSIIGRKTGKETTLDKIMLAPICAIMWITERIWP